MGSKDPSRGVGRGLVALALSPFLLGFIPGTSGISAEDSSVPLAGGVSGPPKDTLPSALRGDGFPAADYGWRLKELDGTPTSLGEFRGQVLFINMWATWCAPCVQELAGIEALMEALSEEAEGPSFLLVSPEEPEVVERFLRARGYDLPVYLEVQEMPGAFGLEALPTTWIVDRGGRIVLKHRGAAEWNQPEVKDFLLGLLSG